MSNPQKSWKGQPTTNYVANADTMAGWNNYSNTANGTPAQFITDLGTTGYRMDNVGSWNGVYKSVTVPSTGTYTFSAWIKWIGGSSNVTGGGVYISGWGGGDSATHTNRTLPGQWQRISITLNCTTTSMTFYLISYGGTNNADNSSWQVTMPQIEAGSYVTPFVNGTRSNTQAIKDLTNNNTITASALTYNSDNTFSFNGSNQFINCGTGGALTLGNNGAFTASAWIRISALKNYSGIISKVESSRPGTYSFMCCAHNDGTLNFYNNSSWYYSNNVGITTNTWYNVAFSFNGSTMSYYVNGVAAGTSALTWSETTAHNVFVGSWYSPNTSYDFNGTIANAQLYNRGLSAAEVQQNFQALRGRYGI
jgi:hypothetical protein